MSWNRHSSCRCHCCALSRTSLWPPRTSLLPLFLSRPPCTGPGLRAPCQGLEHSMSPGPRSFLTLICCPLYKPLAILSLKRTEHSLILGPCTCCFLRQNAFFPSFLLEDPSSKATSSEALLGRPRQSVPSPSSLHCIFLCHFLQSMQLYLTIIFKNLKLSQF